MYNYSITIDNVLISVGQRWESNDNFALIRAIETRPDNTIWIEYQNREGIIGEKTYTAFKATFKPNTNNVLVY